MAHQVVAFVDMIALLLPPLGAAAVCVLLRRAKLVRSPSQQVVPHWHTRLLGLFLTCQPVAEGRDAQMSQLHRQSQSPPHQPRPNRTAGRDVQLATLRQGVLLSFFFICSKGMSYLNRLMTYTTLFLCYIINIYFWPKKCGYTGPALLFFF